MTKNSIPRPLIIDDFGKLMTSILLNRSMINNSLSTSPDIIPVPVLVSAMGVCNSLSVLVKALDSSTESTKWITLKLRNSMTVPVLIGEKTDAFSQITENTILSPGEVMDINMTSFSRRGENATLKLYIKDHNNAFVREVKLIIGESSQVSGKTLIGVKTISSGMTPASNPHLNWDFDLNEKLSSWWLNREGIYCDVVSSISFVDLNAGNEQSINLDVALF